MVFPRVVRLLLVGVATALLVACSAGVEPAGAGGAGTATRSVELAVEGGEVTGDTGVVEVAAGERVAVTVTSDVADEVHVHGPGDGASAEVGAGGTVTVEVVQSAPGEYEVELEQAQRLLTRLRVR